MTRPSKLLNRDSALLWQGHLVSHFGDQAFVVVMALWVKQTTGSALLVGLLMLAWGLPLALLGPLGESVAGRLPRGNALILGALVSGVAALSLGWLMLLSPDGSAALIWLFVITVASSAARSLFWPTLAGALADCVPISEIPRAGFVRSLSGGIAGVLGQGLSGALLRALGAPLLLLLDGLLCLTVAVSGSYVSLPPRAVERPDLRQRAGAFVRDLSAGLAFAWEGPGLRSLFILSTVAGFVGASILVLLPFYVEDYLRVGAAWYGVLLAAYGVGLLAGYYLSGGLRVTGQARGTLTIGLMAVEACTYGLLVQTNALGAVALVVVGGFAGGLVARNVITVVQTTLPAEVSGRVIGLFGFAAASLTPVGAALAGLIADLTGRDIPLLFVSCSVILLVLSAATALGRASRELLSAESLALREA